jgi:hypothetical protein
MKEVVVQDLTESMKMLEKCIQTVNQAHYVEILKLLREAVRIKRPELWPSEWIISPDSASVHRAVSDPKIDY